MAGAKRGSWIAGALVTALLVAAASWFVMISPKLAEAADTRAEVDSTQQQNDLLALQVAKLKADSARLGDYQAELAGLRTQIPATADLPGYLRRLDAAAQAHGVTLLDITTSTPQAAVTAATDSGQADGAATTDPAATAAASPAGADATGTGAAGTADAAAAALPAGFVTVPVTVRALGTYVNVLAFLTDVQTADQRLLLVTGLDGSGKEQADGNGAGPATAVGDLELQITGYLFVLPDAPQAAPAAPTQPPTLPGAVPGKNPLVPVAN